jgi:hypothetical protein
MCPILLLRMARHRARVGIRIVPGPTTWEPNPPFGSTTYVGGHAARAPGLPAGSPARKVRDRSCLWYTQRRTTVDRSMAAAHAHRGSFPVWFCQRRDCYTRGDRTRWWGGASRHDTSSTVKEAQADLVCAHGRSPQDSVPPRERRFCTPKRAQLREPRRHLSARVVAVGWHL